MAEEKTKLCFVVGPIGPPDSDIRNHSDFVLEMIIKPVMAKFPTYTVKRADQMARPGMIDTQIITALRDADLVIADLSRLNPNVFYEIGIRHMFGKPTVHMQLEAEVIPFDVSLYSAVKFSMHNPKAFDAAKIELEGHVKQAIDPKHEVDNPVTRVLGREKSNVSAMPEIKALSATVESLAQELATIKRVITDDRLAAAVGSARGQGNASALARALSGDISNWPPPIPPTTAATRSGLFDPPSVTKKSE